MKLFYITSKGVQETKCDADERAIEQGVEASISIQFSEEDNGDVSLLSFTISKGYHSVDYSLSLDTPLIEVIKDLIQ